jgi:hypothetical protein
VKVANPRSHIDGKNDCQAEKHLHRTGALDKQYDSVDDKGNNADVENIKQSNIGKNIQHFSLKINL